MSDPTYRPDQDEGEHVALDIYGVKARARVGDLGEPSPTTMREAVQQIRKHLLRIFVAPTRLIAETLEGVTRLVRGTSTLPGALSTRMQDARTRADQREEQRQEAVQSSPSTSAGAAEGDAAATAERRRLIALLERIASRTHNGALVDASIVDLVDHILVRAGTAVSERAAIEEIASSEMKQLPAGAEEESAARNRRS